MTRREILALLSSSAATLSARQDKSNPSVMASRQVRAVPRGKSSGLPFHSCLTDISRQAGLAGISIGGHPDKADYVIEAMGCGVAFLDFDNDGWQDILVLSSSRFGDPPPQASNRLYKNRRDGTFADVTEAAGLFHAGYCYGVTIGDYNNDGREDIFVTGWPRNLLYRNNGDGTFTEVTKEAALVSATARFGTGCTFVDYDRDGKLDLFVSNYVDFDMKTVPRAGDLASCNSEGVFCGPRGLPYGKHSLYRNTGDGTFEDVTERAGIAKASAGYGLTVVAADFDNDGWPDIYVACDSTPSLYFQNQHDGTFVEQAMARGIALSEDGMEQAGMGVAVGDILTQGNLDIVKTHFAADTPAVYSNTGKGEFRDDTLRSGLAVETRFISWGAGIEDLDNDGDPDIVWVTGGIYPELQNRGDQPYKTPRIVFRNLGKGRFEELIGQAGSGVDAAHSSRGCAFGDFDNDGDLDLVIMNQNEPPSLLKNDVTSGFHWLKVKLIGTKSNRSAIGARATVRYGGKAQAKEILGQSSYLSVSDQRLHFGLGTAKAVDIEIRWPLGLVERYSNAGADQLIEITEGQGITGLHKFKAS